MPQQWACQLRCLPTEAAEFASSQELNSLLPCTPAPSCFFHIPHPRTPLYPQHPRPLLCPLGAPQQLSADKASPKCCLPVSFSPAAGRATSLASRTTHPPLSTLAHHSSWTQRGKHLSSTGLPATIAHSLPTTLCALQASTPDTGSCLDACQSMASPPSPVAWVCAVESLGIKAED